MKKINKKGASTEHNFLFSLGEVVFGALIILGMMHIISSAVLYSGEQIVAKDLALTASTLQAAPFNANYFYQPNTEKYTIVIKDGVVDVTSKDNSGEENILPLEGIKLDDANFISVTSIPMTYQNKEVSFQRQNIQNDYCAGIPSNFPANPKVYIGLDPNSQQGRLQSVLLFSTKDTLKLSAKVDNSKKFQITDKQSDADIIILLYMSTQTNNNIKINYYQKDTNLNYKKISCYIRNELSALKTDMFTSINQFPTDTSPQILIDLSTLNTMADNMDKYKGMDEIIAKSIYTALTKVLK